MGESAIAQSAPSAAGALRGLLAVGVRRAAVRLPCLAPVRGPVPAPPREEGHEHVYRLLKRRPDFAPAALSAGFAAVHALPMRLREQAIGAVSLYSTQSAELGGQTAELGQALADVATIGILHERAVHRREAVTEQMEKALSSRITIEQAKGVLAERLHVTIEEAFTLMRAYAHDHSLKLADTARAITAGELHITLPG
jgi:uncharacterized protein YigA (DUF484 family)